MIATGAKLAADRNAAPAAANQPGAQSEIRSAEIRSAEIRSAEIRTAAVTTAETADTPQAPSPRSDGAVPAPAQLTWLEDPSVMDGSWRKWPSLTDF
jgi:hypothetical protein